MRETRHADLARAADHPEVQTLLHIVVIAILRIDDPDIDVIRAGEQLERVHPEPRDALGMLRHLDAVHERVRPIHADPVVAVDVETEDRVAHAGRVAVLDLERRRLARFEHGALLTVARDDASADDLDLLASVARTDLPARRALALLAGADLEVVLRDHVAHRPARRHATAVEPDRALAEPTDRAEVVGDEDERL